MPAAYGGLTPPHCSCHVRTQCLLKVHHMLRFYTQIKISDRLNDDLYISALYHTHYLTFPWQKMYNCFTRGTYLQYSLAKNQSMSIFEIIHLPT